MKIEAEKIVFIPHSKTSNQLVNTDFTNGSGKVSFFYKGYYVGLINKNKIFSFKPKRRIKNHVKGEFEKFSDLKAEIIVYLSGVNFSEEPLKYFKTLSPKDYLNDFELNKGIEEYLDIFKQKRFYSQKEKLFIATYSGYGGLEKKGASLKEGKGLLFEYYTPIILIQKMWALAFKHGFNYGKVLEPSCGRGHFLDYAPKCELIKGFEINPYSARICSILHESDSIEVHNQSFEKNFFKGNAHKEPKAEYDLVIGNPPYGEFTGRYGSVEGKRTKTKKYDHYFVSRGVDLLKEGGLLVFVISQSLFQPKFKKVFDMIEAKTELLDAYLLPNNLFERTSISTVLIVLKKRSLVQIE